MSVTFELFGWRFRVGLSAERVVSLDEQIADACEKVFALAH